MCTQYTLHKYVRTYVRTVCMYVSVHVFEVLSARMWHICVCQRVCSLHDCVALCSILPTADQKPVPLLLGTSSGLYRFDFQEHTRVANSPTRVVGE